MGWKILYHNGMIHVILIQYAMHIWLQPSHISELMEKFLSTTVTDRKFVGQLYSVLPINAEKFTGSSKKNLAKFSDTCSVRAGGLCIGSPR